MTLTSATAIAIALTGFDLHAAAAGSDGITARQATEIGAARRSRRGNPAVPLAAFGALSGAMISIAAARQREANYGPYYTPYYAPHVYEPYRRRLFEHRDY